MHISEYMTKKDISVEEMANRLNVSAAAVYKYISGQRIPSRKKMPLVVATCEGEVTPNDFYKVNGAINPKNKKVK